MFFGGGEAYKRNYYYNFFVSGKRCEGAGVELLGNGSGLTFGTLLHIYEEEQLHL